MGIKDTTKQANQVLVEIYRGMSSLSKGDLIFDAYRTGRELAMAGLRESHPDATEKQIWHLWAKQHLGEKLFKEVYGEVPDK
ncbi:MAG TPA: hypothetical protein HPP66_07105 [Planctomycetes bacterium]|nr:hypothetical protein [Planctomycetota bacterium]